ncbi:putative enzyme of heme biosynthesis [Burkholderiales bacterium JOSHI_001]|nr:putative enzyme of heme biosynthesis [Burkholderiales bacterium JOSHI_001]
MLAALAAVVLCVAALVLAWTTHQRMRALEQELVRRTQDTQNQGAESRALAKQAQENARDATAKVALLEARVAESSLQRSQLEDLIQAMSRSRDENMLADVDAALRVAVQQSALTGSTDPLMTTLRQAEERLARANQPRLERVRRAVAHDIDKVKAVGAVDIASLTLRLDEVVRLVDALPLLSEPSRGAARADTVVVPTVPAPAAASAVSAASAASSANPAAPPGLLPNWSQAWQAFGQHLWREVRGLVRVTRIDQPEAMLVSPEQAWYLRENLKLRLLNARLALMSRQFDSAQNDLRDALAALDRYFDRGAKRVLSARELVQQVAAQARLVNLPRPEETLSAITAVQAGR